MEFHHSLYIHPPGNPRFFLDFKHALWISINFLSYPPGNSHLYPQQGDNNFFLEKAYDIEVELLKKCSHPIMIQVIQRVTDNMWENFDLPNAWRNSRFRTL